MPRYEEPIRNASFMRNLFGMPRMRNLFGMPRYEEPIRNASFMRNLFGMPRMRNLFGMPRFTRSVEPVLNPLLSQLR